MSAVVQEPFVVPYPPMPPPSPAIPPSAPIFCEDDCTVGGNDWTKDG